MAETTTIAILLNPAAGNIQSESVKPLLQAHLPGSRIFTAREGSDVALLARQAVAEGCSLVVAGGGDGTIRTVAQELAGTRAILGVLPLGTRNHVAQALRIPLDLEQAVRLLITGEPRAIDIGEVNGRTFLLYAALGLYPLFVREREQHEQRGRRHTAMAFARALWAALRRYPYLNLRLDVDCRQFATRTPFVFVTNNIASIEHLPFAVLTCPNVGQLGVYTAHEMTRLRLLHLAIRLLVRRLTEASDLQALCTPRLRLETSHRHLWVATDGEVTRMTTPVEAHVRRGALRVWVPRHEQGVPIPETERLS